MILTVEEAAHEIIFKDDNIEDLIGNESYWEAAQDAFRLGAAWQKEQGIEWISIEDRLPECSGEGFWVLVYRGGANVPDTVFWHSGKKEFYGTHASVRPTHWAYIKLPKTDK